MIKPLATPAHSSKFRPAVSNSTLDTLVILAEARRSLQDSLRDIPQMGLNKASLEAAVDSFLAAADQHCRRVKRDRLDLAWSFYLAG